MDCTACQLHLYRRQIVYGEGSIPADVLFIGEAPGRTEDLRGKPFCGTSGRLLRKALKDVAGNGSYYITNIVLCRPCNGFQQPNRQPTEAEIEACRPHLVQTLKLVKPKVVVFLGRIAERYASHLCRGQYIAHPASILRQGGESSAQWLSFVREIEDAFDRASKGFHLQAV